jgi:hypothetical protein
MALRGAVAGDPPAHDEHSFIGEVDDDDYDYE